MNRLAIFVAFALVSGDAASQTKPAPQRPEGFYNEISEIRFDESLGKKKATPVLPKSWRFVGVSNGDKRNANHLWFQDPAGNIYLVKGFADDSGFTLNEQIQVLRAK